MIVDASITASWLLPDETNDFAAELYDSRDQIGLHVPAIWNYEIRNILIVDERRGRITTQAANAAFGFLTGVGLVIDQNADGMMWSNWLGGSHCRFTMPLTLNWLFALMCLLPHWTRR